MRKFLFTIFLVLSVGAVTAQKSIPDSLVQVLQKQETDSGRMEILTLLAKHYDNVDSTKAWSYYREMEKLAVETGSEVYMGYTMEMAGILSTRYDHKKALGYYNKAIELLSRHQQSLRIKQSIASLNNNLGVIHYLNGDLEGALRFFMEAVKFYELNDPRSFNLGYGYGNIATTYADLKKVENAAVYSKKAIDFAEKFTNKGLLMSASIAHGSILLKLGKFAESSPYFERAKKIAEEMGNNYNLYLYHYNIGEYYMGEKEYSRALDEFQASLRYARIMDSPIEIGNAAIALGTTYTDMGNYAQAKIFLDTAEQVALRNKLKLHEQLSYEALATWSEKTGNYKQALDYKNRFIAIRDSTYEEDNVRRVEFLDAQYQGEKKEKEILALQKDKEIQSLRLKQNKGLNYILAGSILALLIVGFLTFRNLRQRRKLAQQQHEMQRQRILDLEKDKQLVAVDSMLKGQEEERSRLAKDLHDGLGGLLSGVKFSLINMKDNLIITPENMNVFERSLDMIDNSIRELRRVAHSMMPEMLDRFGLDEALKEYCNNIHAAGLVEVKYQSHGLEARINKQAEIIVYRIIQELLNNVLKHAEAKHVFIQLVRTDSRLNVVVEDDGKGFDPAVTTGAGLVSIRSRVDYLKGQLDIHANPGKGTLVNIEFNSVS